MGDNNIDLLVSILEAFGCVLQTRYSTRDAALRAIGFFNQFDEGAKRAKLIDDRRYCGFKLLMQKNRKL
jgi:hypothetical protein